MIKEQNILFLFSFFRTLQQHDFKLGINEYDLLIKSLQGGFGIGSETDLKFLCKKIWLKNKDNEEVFDKLFDDFIKIEKRKAIHYFEEKHKQKATNEEPVIDNTTTDDLSKSDRTTKEEFDKEEEQLPKNEELKSEIETEDTLTLTIENLSNEEAAHFDDKGKFIIDDLGFLFNTDYSNLHTNKIKHSIRFLRNFEKCEYSDEINIEQSILKAIKKAGMLDVPVFNKTSKSKAKLISLIDHEGSMVAFHAISERLYNIVEQEKAIQNSIYYFHNLPDKYVFVNQSHTQAELFVNVLAKLKHKQSSLLILSDAGAAKGSLNPERIELTQQLFKKILSYTKQVAWINPMPINRWKGTSAEEISKLVPMFECTEKGISSAINVLRGKLKSNILK